MMTDDCEVMERENISDNGHESSRKLRDLYDQALRRLSQREYGEEELRRKLMQYSDNAIHIDTVLAQMKQAGHLSDERFIEAYIQSRVRRGFGSLRIRSELREKGIIDEQLEGHLSIWGSSWITLAKRVLEKKYGGTADTPSAIMTQKRFLMYRGFAPETIHRVFKNEGVDE